MWLHFTERWSIMGRPQSKAQQNGCTTQPIRLAQPALLREVIGSATWSPPSECSLALSRLYPSKCSKTLERVISLYIIENSPKCEAYLELHRSEQIWTWEQEMKVGGRKTRERREIIAAWLRPHPIWHVTLTLLTIFLCLFSSLFQDS